MLKDYQHGFCSQAGDPKTSNCRKVAILVAPNVHVAITAYATYYMLENHGGPLNLFETLWLTYKVSVVRNFIITIGMWHGDGEARLDH